MFGRIKMKRRNFLAAAAAGSLAITANVPRKANAGHHRGHAIGYLEIALGHESDDNKNVNHFFNHFIKNIDFTDENLEHSLKTVGYLEQSLTEMPKKMNEAIFLLQSGTADDLFIVRRLINRARRGGPYQHRALLYHAFKQIFWLDQLAGFIVIDPPPGNLWAFSYTLNLMTKVWENLDLALWHVNDAIKEDFYEDPAFGFGDPDLHFEP